MDGKSCGIHVIEVKKCKNLSKPKNPLTLIQFQYFIKFYADGWTDTESVSKNT